ncbi:MAG TPA: NTP transferase domain-containing protein [Anaerolineae bacterium]|nr:NTP transferase domain-containing protein [Anaerolineae bacterium]
MIEQPHMLLLGSAGRKSGKTELACRLLRKFSRQHDLVGIKVVTITTGDKKFHSDGELNTVFPGLKETYHITEEKNTFSDKDTSRMLNTGAKRVFILCVLKDYLKQGYAALMDIIGSNTPSLCESNSLRTVVEPGLFLVLKRSDSSFYKPSCRAVLGYADRIIISEENRFDINLDQITLIDGTWVMQRQATAIIMAGGKSNRMGHDKSMLHVNGIPMIEHIIEQIRPCFDELLISSDDREKFSFLNVHVIPDSVPGQGPLMGILSCLKTSSNDLNFVIACDVPTINHTFLARMFRLVDGYDGVIPRIEDSKYEPLFGIYRKSMIVPIQNIINAGGRKISEVFSTCKINFIDFANAEWYKNLNTLEEYKRLSGTCDHRIGERW